MMDEEERDYAVEAYARLADYIVKEYAALPTAHDQSRFLWICLKDLRLTLREHLESVGNAKQT